MPRKAGKNKDLFDKQFEAFLKESISSDDGDSAKGPKPKKEKKPKPDSKPWWMQSDDYDDDEGIGSNFGSGKTSSGKSFLKKKTSVEPKHSTPKHSTPKHEPLPCIEPATPELTPEEKPGKQKARTNAKQRGTRSKGDASMSKDSLEDISEKSEEDSNKDRHGAAARRETTSFGSEKTNRPGIDTLDEIKDKENFFKDLERHADGTIDYQRLNQDLSQSATTMSPAAKTAATLAALDDIEQDKPSPPQNPPQSDDQISQDPSQKPSMLSKVSLMDSMESTMNTTGSPTAGRTGIQKISLDHGQMDEVDGPGQTRTGMLGTTSQEIEALHKALREVGLSPTIHSDDQHGNTTEIVQTILTGEAGPQRGVEEIFKEMEQIEQKSKEHEMDELDVELLSDKRRNQLSPKSLERQLGMDEETGRPEAAPGFDVSHSEDTERYNPVTQVSILERGRQKKKERKNKEKSPKAKDKPSPRQRHSPRSSLKESRSRSLSTSPRRRMSPRKLTSPRRQMSPRMQNDDDPRSQSLSPLNTGLNSVKKFSHVKSSGYGKKSADIVPQKTRQESKTDLEGGKEKVVKESKPRKDGAKDKTSRDSRSKRHRSKDKTGEESKWEESRETSTKKQQSWSPAEVTKQKIKGSDSLRKKNGDSVREVQLKASFDSFAQYIKDHFTDPNMPQVQYSQDEPSLAVSWRGEDGPSLADWQKIYNDEKEKYTILKDEKLSMEKEYDRMLEMQKLEFEDQIFKLKQEIFVLSSKVPVRDGQSGIGEAGGDLVEKLRHEVEEQEKLIAGYQQENKRTYDQLKVLQKQGKVTEGRMFNENQKMVVEMSSLRTQLGRSEVESRDKVVVTTAPAQPDASAALGASRIAELSAKLKESKIEETNARRDLEVIQRSKIGLEQQVDKLTKERSTLRVQVEQSKALKSAEARIIEDNFKSENDKLSRKLKWYAENQQLLDSDAKRMKDQEEEISRLKLRIQHLTSETGRRLEDNKVVAKERANDAKRIQDLQRQVKEMETIIRRRHPNSLPALMLTAAVAPQEQPSNRTPTMAALENRIKKLELELEGKDTDAEKMLRSVEQKYNNIKVQYEDRISDLETQLSVYKCPKDTAPHQAVALKKELESKKSQYEERIRDLEKQLAVHKHSQDTALNKQQSQYENKIRDLHTELALYKHSEGTASSNHVNAVQRELDSLREFSNSKVSELTMEVSRLNKELVNSHYNQQDKNRKEEQNNRPYQAQAFVDSHLKELLQENEYLKSKVDVLTTSHKKEIQRLCADQALCQSSSQTAELQHKVKAQQVLVKHLREKLVTAELDSEQVSILKIKDAGHKTHIEKLQECLKEAKLCQTPEMKHFDSIQEKIIHMEGRHNDREKELQEVIKNARHVATVELEQEVRKWRQIVEAKNNEIQRFRTELDGILEVLRVLQRQGVVIPISAGS